MVSKITKWNGDKNLCLPGAVPGLVPYTAEVLSEEATYLEQLARQWNLGFSTDAQGRLLTFVSRMLEWNARINLTGAKSAGELVIEHLVDSFAMTHFLPTGSSVVDVGAGGGLPGIPLAVLRPDLRLTMVEPRAKRVAFLRTVAHELGLRSVEILRCRSEELEASSFDICASRATFPPEEWLAIGMALAKPGGTTMVFANQPWAPTNTSARLVDSVQYACGGTRSRWMGAFCFT
jgi:16S rRNA (guanine527-N7)-methyltransferase